MGFRGGEILPESGTSLVERLQFLLTPVHFSMGGVAETHGHFSMAVLITSSGKLRQPGRELGSVLGWRACICTHHIHTHLRLARTNTIPQHSLTQLIPSLRYGCTKDAGRMVGEGRIFKFCVLEFLLSVLDRDAIIGAGRWSQGRAPAISHGLCPVVKQRIGERFAFRSASPSIFPIF